MRSAIETSFERSFGLYHDLLASFDEATLSCNLPGLPSNSVGLQLWCVVGARESFAAAVRANEWRGFSCSLQSTSEVEPVATALQSSAGEILDLFTSIGEFTGVQERLLVDLLEHEAAHHGQLIRYLYGLRLPIPPSWKEKYALD